MVNIAKEKLEPEKTESGDEQLQNALRLLAEIIAKKAINDGIAGPENSSSEILANREVVDEKRK